MCGINGIYAYNRPAPQPSYEELIATRDAMRARGPDGDGSWASADSRCLLGHRRLKILDLSDRAAQPMLSADESVVVTYNGEIYNYPELRSELEADGVTFQSNSDTEILLHLYRREGSAMLPRLRGMFAFAIWDVRECGLFLARDPFGIKPLYTANDGWTFRFASQVKALLAGGAVSRDPEPGGIVGFHLWGSVPEPFTLYREIRSLPAGHCQWIDAAGPRAPQAYFNIAEVLATAGQPSGTLVSSLREILAETVQSHLQADVEVGLFLSAGVDSGAMLGALPDGTRQRIRTITLGFDEFAGTTEDEVPLAARAASSCGAHHLVRRVSEAEFRTDLPLIMAAMDQPSIDGINNWFVAKAAKEVGLKVALSGVGADEILGGYPSFVDVPRWKHRFGSLASLPGAGAALRQVLRVVRPRIATETPKAAGMLDHAGTWEGAYLLRRGLYLPHELPALLGSELAAEGLRRLQPLHMLRQALTPDPGSDVARVAALELTSYMRNQLLRDADWAGMAHSVEIRVPYVDTRVLRAVAPYLRRLEIPAGKAALAEASAHPISAELKHRRKTGFGTPAARWQASVLGQGPARPVAKGLESRTWSQAVIEGAA